MPRMGYVVAAIAGIVGAFMFSGIAGGQQPAGSEPDWSCRASVARLDITGFPSPIEPITANPNDPTSSPCADDAGGPPTIALPPPPDEPVITADAVEATTDVLCRTSPAPNPDTSTQVLGADDACDEKHSYDQQVIARATAGDVHIVLGDAPNQLDIRAEVANSFARAYCDENNLAAFQTDSEVVNLTINGQPIEIPPPTAAEPNGDEDVEIDVGPLATLILNERVGAPDGTRPDDATEASVIRRAIHLMVPAGNVGDEGDIDLVVGESKADFRGDVCPEGTVVIKKETAPDEADNSTEFGFSTSPGLTPSTFKLTDDGSRTFTEVQPGTHSVTEDPQTPPWALASIICADPTDNTTSGGRTALVNVAPGEKVTCTFVNTNVTLACPEGTVGNEAGECIIIETQCPPGSTKNPQGQCIINQTQCPPGSTKNPQGQCVVTETNCPPGSTKNAKGECVAARASCPEGTQYAPNLGACIPVPVGGRIVNDNELPPGPCRDFRVGRSFAVLGTNGPDRITGSNLSDRIFSLAGNDRVSGGRGDDCVEGGSGADVLDGSNGNDLVFGESGSDRGAGGPGRDRLVGGSGRDRLDGGAGNDRVNGGRGNDKIRGGDGNDLLVGGSGKDGLHTGNGKDRVFAGSGNDIVNAGTRGPAAFVDCGPGRDRVRINNNERNRIRNCEFVDVFHRIRRG